MCLHSLTKDADSFTREQLNLKNLNTYSVEKFQEFYNKWKMTLGVAQVLSDVDWREGGYENVLSLG